MLKSCLFFLIRLLFFTNWIFQLILTLKMTYQFFINYHSPILLCCGYWSNNLSMHSPTLLTGFSNDSPKIFIQINHVLIVVLYLCFFISPISLLGTCCNFLAAYFICIHTYVSLLQIACT